MVHVAVELIGPSVLMCTVAMGATYEAGISARLIRSQKLGYIRLFLLTVNAGLNQMQNVGVSPSAALRKAFCALSRPPDP
jgi:hypothetical protein